MKPAARLMPPFLPSIFRRRAVPRLLPRRAATDPKFWRQSHAGVLRCRRRTKRGASEALYMMSLRCTAVAAAWCCRWQRNAPPLERNKRIMEGIQRPESEFERPFPAGENPGRPPDPVQLNPDVAHAQPQKRLGPVAPPAAARQRRACGSRR